MYVCHQKSLIRCFRKFSRSLLQRIQGSALIRHQHQLSDWLKRYNKSTKNRIQTPLLRFVVDLLLTRICCRRSICRGFAVQHFDLLWICRGFVVQLVVQQIHNKSNRPPLVEFGFNARYSGISCIIHTSMLTLPENLSEPIIDPRA